MLQRNLIYVGVIIAGFLSACGVPAENVSQSPPVLNATSSNLPSGSTQSSPPTVTDASAAPSSLVSTTTLVSASPTDALKITIDELQGILPDLQPVGGGQDESIQIADGLFTISDSEWPIASQTNLCVEIDSPATTGSACVNTDDVSSAIPFNIGGGSGGSEMSLILVDVAVEPISVSPCDNMLVGSSARYRIVACVSPKISGELSFTLSANDQLFEALVPYYGV